MEAIARRLAGVVGAHRYGYLVDRYHVLSKETRTC